MSAGSAGADRGYAVVDVDSHIYEVETLWDRYVPAEYQAVVRSAFWHGLDEDGYETTILNGTAVSSLNRSRIVRQAIWRPGMTPQDIGALDPARFHALTPGAYDPGARLEDMDTLGVDQAVMHPSLFLEYFPLIENPDAARVLATAYNDWIFDLCQTDPVRLHPVGVLPLQSLLFARRELARLVEKGFRAVAMRPMFYSGPIDDERGPQAQLVRAARQAVLTTAQPRGAFIESAHFEPVWRDIDDAAIVACVHPSQGSSNPEGTSEGSLVERLAAKLDIGHNVAEAIAYMQDNGIFLTAACFHGLMEDYPNLRIALVHSGASWVPLCLEKSETYLWLAFASVFGFSKPVSLEPREVFEAQPVIMSFDSWERPVARMADDLFAEKAAWGSRYPHHDASAPEEAISLLEEHAVAPETIARLMGGHAAELFELPVSVKASASARQLETATDGRESFAARSEAGDHVVA
jgi:predicted TIM-barrel fold metal-dependent hydrolase